MKVHFSCVKKTTWGPPPRPPFFPYTLDIASVGGFLLFKRTFGPGFNLFFWRKIRIETTLGLVRITNVFQNLQKCGYLGTENKNWNQNWPTPSECVGGGG
jgi:hypothetical protein